MKLYLVIFKSFLILVLIFTLTGCDNGRNTAVICNKNPELCSDLHKDSWCKFERGHLIRHRFSLKNIQTPSSKQLYRQLEHLEAYSECIELASGVRHIIHTERTNDRLKAYGISTQNLQELQFHTQNSQSPLLAYYHWSRFNDLDALEVLLAAEKNKLIKDPELLGYIGAYYLKQEPSKAKRLYLEAISLSNQENFNSDWLLGLADVYQLVQDFERTYMLSKANILFSKKHISNDQMMALIKGNQELGIYLDQQAAELAEVIREDRFNSSQVKLDLSQPIKRL